MTAPKLTPDTPATRRAFNRLAREKMKLRLLADIRMDLMVCELEGWSKVEYLDELLALVEELRKKGGGEDGERKKPCGAGQKSIDDSEAQRRNARLQGSNRIRQAEQHYYAEGFGKIRQSNFRR